MQNTTSSGHPLNIPRADETGIAHAIPVVYAPLKNISDGFYTTVGVHWESADRTFRRVIEGKMIEQKERVKPVGNMRNNRTAQEDPRTFHNILRFNDIPCRATYIHTNYLRIRRLYRLI